MNRFIFVSVLWGLLLFGGWHYTTLQFLTGKKNIINNSQYNTDTRVIETFSKNWKSFEKNLQEYFKIYSISFPLQKPYDRFLEKANNYLLAIQKQYRQWARWAEVLPMGSPLQYNIKHRNFLFLFILSGFGRRYDPFISFPSFHTGLDLQARKGEEVYATGDGIIIASDNNKAYGKNIIIAHAYGFQSLYGHLSEVNPKITFGRKVKKGEEIGFTGDSGRTTGPHLHYEIRNQGVWLNPWDYLNFGKNLPLEKKTLSS